MIPEQLSHYRILNKLGAGGMGEVWLAEDTRLNRKVAIKVLPTEFAQNADRLRRFEQEARATSALNHPNILTVYDIGTASEGNGAAPFIVMELLEGEELRQPLKAGPIAPRKAVDYARQIASGLAAAHAKGIVHRDLKPENLFVTTDGRVKILDFGLAKLRPQQNGPVDSQVATQKKITDPGTVMGTVGYMAPEQVRGQETDHRSDIFSFGVILYEMLAGERPFSGASAVEVMNAILKEEPPEFDETKTKTGAQLEKIVRHCLEKQPEHRFHSAHDLGFALEALSTPSDSRLELPTGAAALSAVNSKARLFRNSRLAWAVATIFFTAALILAMLYFKRTPTEVAATRFTISAPEKTTFASLSQAAVSPDGRHIVFVAADAAGKTQLWVRALDALTPRTLPGTDGALAPFWSPEGRFIDFLAAGKLKKIELSGGPAIALCDTNQGLGGAWNRDGVIVFSRGQGDGLYRVSASGGVATPVTTLEAARGETGHYWPQFLPDGRHFVYFSISSARENNGINLGSLDAQQSKRLINVDSSVAYVAPGYLLFVRDGTLLAQPFDARQLQLTGEPVPIAEQVKYFPGLFRAAFSVSENGVLAYETGNSFEKRQLAWFDRAGKQLELLGAPDYFYSYRIAPDGQQVAAEIMNPQVSTADLWLFEIRRGIRSRFTSDPGSDMTPQWSPDGKRIAYSIASASDSVEIYQKLSNSAGNEEALLKLPASVYRSSFLCDWSPDGRFIVYQTYNPKTKYDLWLLPLTGERQPTALLNTAFGQQQGQFSPDGKWLAYTSDESGKNEVYIQPFPLTGAKYQVSTGGGSHLRWRRDGKELFYLDADRKLMAVPIQAGAALAAGSPQSLFELRGVGSGAPRRYPYDVTADGQRFLVSLPVSEATTPITIVLNWTAEVKR
jgi:eukaryotic-like serine/threonine-protein kinase